MNLGLQTSVSGFTSHWIKNDQTGTGLPLHPVLVPCVDVTLTEDPRPTHAMSVAASFKNLKPANKRSYRLASMFSGSP